MIAFVLYGLKSRLDAGASGGHISNVELISRVAESEQVIVIAPSLSASLVDQLTLQGVSVLTKELGSAGFVSRMHRRSWIQSTARRVFENYGRELSAVFSSAGTADLVSNCFPADRKFKHVILVRAFEDMFYSRHARSLKSMVKGFILDATSLFRVRRAYIQSDLIVTNSEFMKREVSAYFGGKIRKISVIYPPIEEVQAHYRALPASLRIGIVNPSHRKGEGIFVGLARRMPQHQFIYFSRESREFQNSNIEYGGWAASPGQIYSKVDLMIAPSQWSEPFGRVAPEAISHGVPILVSRVGGLPETVDARFHVPSREVTDWVAAVESLLLDPALAQEGWVMSARLLEKFSKLTHDQNTSLILNWIKS